MPGKPQAARTAQCQEALQLHGKEALESGRPLEEGNSGTANSRKKPLPGLTAKASA